MGGRYPCIILSCNAKIKTFWYRLTQVYLANKMKREYKTKAAKIFVGENVASVVVSVTCQLIQKNVIIMTENYFDKPTIISSPTKLETHQEINSGHQTWYRS